MQQLGMQAVLFEGVDPIYGALALILMFLIVLFCCFYLGCHKPGQECKTRVGVRTRDIRTAYLVLQVGIMGGKSCLQVFYLCLFYLCLFGLSIALGEISPYTVFNYTWIIKNEAGDVVNSSSSLGTQPHWPVLEVDLCKLALGASPAWGTPSHYMPQSKPINAPNPNYDAHLGGCNSHIKRASLAEDMTGLYVCPGTHRDRSLNYKCGYNLDYFCASWGCETTGNAWWKPSSSWDYILLRRKYLPEYLQEKLGITTQTPKKTLCQNSWCIPLLINFTEPGRKRDWTGRGFTWGLRLKECFAITINCEDPGLLFTISLSKTLPNSGTALGPNKVLGGGGKAPMP